MSKTATVKWGWIIPDQASVIHGMSTHSMPALAKDIASTVLAGK